MKILKENIVSNSEMIKYYRLCREKAESTGKLFIFRNNRPDAVLFSINEIEKYSPILEYFDNLDNEAYATALELLKSFTLPISIATEDSEVSG